MTTGEKHGPAELAWLSRMRWTALLGQTVTIGVAHLLPSIALASAALFAVVGVQALLQLALSAPVVAKRTRGPAWVAASFALDMVGLSVLLALSGGPHNPFSFLYLVYITMAAVVLPPRHTWALVGLAVACSALLFVAPTRPLFEEPHHDGGFMRLHLQGMWVAFAVAAAFSVYFVMRMRTILARREAELRRMHEQAARNEKLTSLATLAAGAAHELATPLGTIATVSNEVHRSLASTPVLDAEARRDLMDDATLIRAEVGRCRDILEQMTMGAGAIRAEVPERLALADIAHAALAELAAEDRARVVVRVADAVAATAINAPRTATVRALKNLLVNALDASQGLSDERGRVELLLAPEATGAFIRVADRGCGISPEALARVGEPFFTTKGAGAGMGLGVFVARSVATQLRGTLDIRSQAGAGTTVELRLPYGPGGSAR